jgi:hypothetical protein
MTKVNLAAIRRAVADYIASEGCSCCQNVDAHRDAAERLGKLLRVPRYSDGSGRNFYKYKTERAE